LRFAVTPQLAGISIHTVGVILMSVGVLALGIGLVRGLGQRSAGPPFGG
jgi:hypothetical protein